MPIEMLQANPCPSRFQSETLILLLGCTRSANLFNCIQMQGLAPLNRIWYWECREFPWHVPNILYIGRTRSPPLSPPKKVIIRPPSNVHLIKFFWLKQHSSISINKFPFSPSLIPSCSYLYMWQKKVGQAASNLQICYGPGASGPENILRLQRLVLNIPICSLPFSAKAVQI